MEEKEAIERIKARFDKWALDDEDMKAIQTLIPELTESEDERIIRAIIDALYSHTNSINLLSSRGYQMEDIEDWLEKQKENIEKEYVFRPLAGTDITIAAEQAIRKTDEGDSLVLAFNGAYIPVRKGVNANKIVDIYDAFFEKQKDASKAIEAVDRIDKCIDEHLANAHDMKDSNPDKKYYRGWDDALGKMAGILQDVYSEEKQKDLTTENIYKHSRERMSFYNGQQKEQKPAEWNPTNEDVILFNKAITTNQNLTPSERAKLDIIRMKFKHCNGQIATNDFDIALGERYIQGYNDGINESKQEWSEEDERMLSRCIKSIECSKKFADSETYKAAKDVEINWLKDIFLNHKKFTEAVDKLWSNEWSDDDKEALDMCLDAIPKRWKTKSGILLTKWLKDNIHLQPKQEWSEEDEDMIQDIIASIDTCVAASDFHEMETWLKSLRPHWKPSKEQMEALINCVIGNEYDVHALVRLWAELKKLYKNDSTR